MSDVPQPQPSRTDQPSSAVHAVDQPASANAQSASPSASRNHLPAIPGYEVLDKLGAGGMGVVYKARHLALNRLVAIKVLNRIQQATEREILRLQVEGETVANLQHPNIVPLYQMGEFAGLPFLAFEYIDGGTLADRIAGRPQPPREAAEMVELLARAVQLAHQQGVLHRDLKPANVLLSKDGVPKIADFGLARRLDYHEYSTELIAGTANYMSPEQAWGDSKANPLTPATDVYSLGAILYELLTGRPPFASESREETIKDVWSKAPAEPRSLTPDVPLDLQTICLKCLAKEPNRRYPSAEALADDLRRWLNNEPIVARPTTRFERAVLWCRRDPVFAGVSAALVVAVLAGAIGGSWLAVIYWKKSNQAEAAGTEAVKAASRARDNAFAADKAAAEAKVSAALADRARAVAELRQAEYQRANKLLEATNDQLEHRLYESMILATARDVELMTQDPRGVAREQLAKHLRLCPARLRDIEWHIRNRQMQGSLLTRPVTQGSLSAMAVSHDGKWAATAAVDLKDSSKDEPVRVWSTEDWQLRASLGKHGQRLVFSPDSQLLVIDNDTAGVEVWNWRENRLLRTFPRQIPPEEKDLTGTPFFRPVEGQAAFSSDGRIFAIGLTSGVQLYRIEEGRWSEARSERTLSTGPVMALNFCPDNQRLVILAYRHQSQLSPRLWESELQIWNRSTGALIRKEPLEGTFKLMSVSEDGRECAVVACLTPGGPSHYELRLYDLADGRYHKLEPSSNPQAVQFSRDGKTLFLASDKGEIDVIDVAGLKVTSSLAGHIATMVEAVDSLPDGRIVSAGADGMLKVWPPDAQSRVPHWFDGDRPFALSRDGRELAVAQADGTVRRFNLDDDRELPRLATQELKLEVGQRTPGDPKEFRRLTIAGLCYGPSPEQLMVAYSDLTIRTWRLIDVQVVASIDLTGPSDASSPFLAQASGYFSSTSAEPRVEFSDDGKYAGWAKFRYANGHRASAEATALMIWELTSGRIVVDDNRMSRPMGDEPIQFRFTTIGGRPLAMIYQKFQNEFPGRVFAPVVWIDRVDLLTGKWQEHSGFEAEFVPTVHGSRSIVVSDALKISDPRTGLLLLQLPLGAKASGEPRLSADRSRLAVATDQRIAVFDVGPMPEFYLPDDASTSARATDKSPASGVKWSHVDHAAVPH
jgi:eukaryotic-like serine/threonine-protein kinase